MILRSPLALSLAILTAVAAGCDKSAPPMPTLPQVHTGTCVVVGRVLLDGPIPTAKSQECVCDPRPDAPKIQHVDRTVTVSKDRGLADVYIYVKGGPKGSASAETPLVLDQRECDFEPHALAIQIGRSLRVRNSDPTFHNVHWDAVANRTMNLGFGPNSAETIVAFAAPEFLAVKCDVHDWMRSTIGIFDNPFFAVTDDHGNYRIPNLPPGTYTLATYHGYYLAGPEKTVTVSPSAETTADFTFGK